MKSWLISYTDPQDSKHLLKVKAPTEDLAIEKFNEMRIWKKSFLWIIETEY